MHCTSDIYKIIIRQQKIEVHYTPRELLKFPKVKMQKIFQNFKRGGNHLSDYCSVICKDKSLLLLEVFILFANGKNTSY